MFQAFKRGPKTSSFDFCYPIPAPQTHGTELLYNPLDLPALLGAVGGFSRTTFGFAQITPRPLGDSQTLFFGTRQDQGHGSFHFPGRELLLAQRKEQRHLQGLWQAAELIGAHRPDLGGPDKGLQILAQPLHEAQSAQDPSFSPPQPPGNALRGKLLSPRQISHQDCLLIEADGPSAAVQTKHHALGRLQVPGLYDYRGLFQALGFQYPQALESVDQFDLAVHRYAGERFLVFRRPGPSSPRRFGALQVGQTRADLLDTNATDFHLLSICDLLFRLFFRK